MSLLSIIILALALSIDTFSVSLSIALCGGDIPTYYKFRYFTIIGVFHIIMLMTGWILGHSLIDVIGDFDHWISFLLLGFLGVKMIVESYNKSEEAICFNKYVNFRNSVFFGFALSVDAIIAGLTLGVTPVSILLYKSQFVNIVLSSVIIGIVAFIFTWLGLVLGKFAGRWLGKYSSIFGGLVLIVLGIKTVISHIF